MLVPNLYLVQLLVCHIRSRYLVELDLHTAAGHSQPGGPGSQSDRRGSDIIAFDEVRYVIVVAAESSVVAEVAMLHFEEVFGATVRWGNIHKDDGHVEDVSLCDVDGPFTVLVLQKLGRAWTRDRP